MSSLNRNLTLWNEYGPSSSTIDMDTVHIFNYLKTICNFNKYGHRPYSSQNSELVNKFNFLMRKLSDLITVKGIHKSLKEITREESGKRFSKGFLLQKPRFKIDCFSSEINDPNRH